MRRLPLLLLVALVACQGSTDKEADTTDSVQTDNTSDQPTESTPPALAAKSVSEPWDGFDEGEYMKEESTRR